MEKSRIRPFSNGSQFADWENRNCDRCRLAPRGEFAQYRCPIQKALGLAYWDSGDVSQKIADRMGYKPEENRYTWDCPERVPIETVTEFRCGTETVYKDGTKDFQWSPCGFCGRSQCDC